MQQGPEPEERHSWIQRRVCVCVCVVGYPTVAMKYPYTYSRVPKLGKQRGKRENTSNYKHKRVWEEHKETQQLETL